MNDQNLHYTKIIETSTEISANFFNSKFKDPMLEKSYMYHLIQNTKFLNIVYFIFGIICYTSAIAFGYDIKIIIYHIINSACLIITVILTIVYFYNDSPQVRSYTQLICNFLFSASLITITYTFMEMKLDEFWKIRIIYGLILIKNFSMLIWTKSNFVIWSLFCILHISFLIFFNVWFKESKADLFIEIIIEILASVASYTIKKLLDSILRVTFLLRMKFQDYFDYNKKLINAMSGLHITFTGNTLIYMNDNTKKLLNFLMDKTGTAFKSKIFKEIS